MSLFVCVCVFGNSRNINQNMFNIKITSNRIENDMTASQVTKG